MRILRRRRPRRPRPRPRTPAAGAAKAGTPGVVELPGEKEFNSCKKLPPGKRIVKLNLKPDTELIDLIGWISSITCSQFLVTIPLQGKKVTVIAPQLITPEEAYRLFYAALESVGLTVEPSGKFLRIVESSRARFSTLPFVGANERVPHDKRYVTKLVRVSYLDTNDLTNCSSQPLEERGGRHHLLPIVAHHQRYGGKHRPPGVHHQAVRHPVSQSRQDLDDPDQEHVRPSTWRDGSQKSCRFSNWGPARNASPARRPRPRPNHSPDRPAICRRK